MKQFGDEGVFDVLNKHTVKHDIMEYVLLSLKRSTHFDYGIAMKYDGGDIPGGYKNLGCDPNSMGGI